MLAGYVSMGQQLTYEPINPAFGGDTFNYNWLISSANAQNGFTQARTETEEESEKRSVGDALSDVLNRFLDVLYLR